MATTIDVTSPLYLHPSDGSSFQIMEKLQGSANFRSWKRSMEIALASKRKLGFVKGTLKKDTADAVKGEAWETCNSMIISWILGSVSESIKKSIMFVDNAHQIWTQLEKRFSLTNGSRKYKLSKELYETKQSTKSVSEYYTQMKAIWEELESLNTLPVISTMTSEVTTLINALEKQKEEQKLFQFLNGLDDAYGAQRSQLLMMKNLPAVETACGYLEQEESQRILLNNIKEEPETLAMFSKGTGGACTACGKPGHTREKCWSVIGYPSWHDKAKQQPQKGRPRNFTASSKWNKNKPVNVKTAANVQSSAQSESNGSTSQFSVQQIEALLRMLPGPSKQGTPDTDDEFDASYAGMVSCYFDDSIANEWIIDSGASDHMTGCLDSMFNVIESKNDPKINLPTGQTARITHSGNVKLGNSLMLENVLYVPTFKHNLVSVNKLLKDSKCKIMFYSEYCIIEDTDSNTIKGNEE